MAVDRQLAQEAKALVAFAFRNGPIEAIHADGRISDTEMKALMKFAVDHAYYLLAVRRRTQVGYQRIIADYVGTLGADAARWDDPEPLGWPRNPEAPPPPGWD